MASHEGKCCDAVLRLIEERIGRARSDVVTDRPEERGVEVECVVDEQRFAIEHTIIEPYPQQLLDNSVLETVMEPVVERLRRAPNLAPGAHFNLCVDAGALARYRGKHEQLSELIAQWAEDRILKVPEPPLGQSTAVKASIGKPPIDVSIIRWGLPSSSGVRVGYLRAAPYRIEDERLPRIRQACKKKLPKLAACARRGLRTVLVLENQDVALTNFIAVSDALTKCLGQHPAEFEPNEVYLVDTPGSGPWTVYLLRCDGKRWSTFENEDDQPFPQFDSATLIDIMAEPDQSAGALQSCRWRIESSTRKRAFSSSKKLQWADAG
jgi:hypothetical protein